MRKLVLLIALFLFCTLVLAGCASRPDATMSSQPKSSTQQYVLNTNTHKFHYPSCSSVKQMKEKNKLIVTWSRQEIIDKGFDPCGKCHP